MDGLDDTIDLVIRTMVPTSPGSAPSDATIHLRGGSSSKEAVVLDTTGVPSGGAHFQADDIDFIAVTGQATLTGGAGDNYATADDAVQFIKLGEGDDTLDGGGGDDEVGSEGGDDILIGGFGDDTITGGTGSDTAEFAGSFAAAAIGRGETVTVTDSATDGGGTDLIGDDVEILAFTADQEMTLVHTDGHASVAGVGFDAAFYLAQNADVAAAVEAGVFADAAEHFAAFGLAEGRAGNPVFDGAWYLSTYTDVADAVAAGVFASPDQHYALFGGQEGRDPGAWFDASAYMDANTDVATSDFSALEHFILHGAGEGRAGIVLDTDLLLA